MNYFSFDLDSTLCDTRHRKGIIEQYTDKGLPVDWRAYAMACAEDAPTGLVSVVRALQVSMPWVVISGRSEGAREATEEWLKAHRLYPRSVYLCDDEDGHTAMGHEAWKVQRILGIAENFPTLIAHFDDFPGIAERLNEQTDGAIAGVTVSRPGTPGKAADGTDNPIVQAL